MDQFVRETIAFCEQKRPEMAGIEAEQLQELLVHESELTARSRNRVNKKQCITERIIGGDKLLRVNAVLDHIVVDQLVRETIGGNRGGTASGAAWSTSFADSGPSCP